MDVRSLLGLRPKDETAAGLRRSLAEAQQAGAAAAERAARLEEQRGAMLLDAAADELEGFERELAEARAAAERLNAFASALPERIAAAEACEADAALTADRDQAEKDAAAGARLLREYERAALELLRMAEEHDALARSVERTNSRLREAGRGERVALPVQCVWPHARGDTWTPATVFLGQQVKLPAPVGAVGKREQFEEAIERAKRPAPEPAGRG